MSAATLQALEDAWRRSDALFDWLAPGTLLARPIPLRHPFVFYLGHLPAFASNQIMVGVLGRHSPQPELDQLFERGIDPLDDDEAAASSISGWPAVAEIEAYRDRVREAIRGSLAAVTARADQDPLAHGGRIYHLVLEHELMHHETLCYMLQALPIERKRRPAGAALPVTGAPCAPQSEPFLVEQGSVTLGADFEAAPFGWDNEFGTQTVSVAAFRLDRHPTTQADWKQFVAAGGYDDRGRFWWSDAGWAWRQQHEITAPRDWHRVTPDAPWRVRSMFDDHPLDDVLAWPVHVSHAEASAYARWRGARLPTEAELQRAAYTTPTRGAPRRFPWGDSPPTALHGAFGFEELAPRPVGTTPESASAWGIEELVGNGWEWTSTPFRPLPGFHAWARTYPGYSADFFDDHHFVVFGAAWPTDVRLTRPSFRNWYQGCYPWPFATLRLAWPAGGRTAPPAP